MTALILPDVNALFLHVPKCGGTWVHRAIASAGIEHRPANPPDGISRIHPPLAAFTARKFDFVFTSVRHPADWLISWWRYQFRGGWRKFEPTLWHPMREVEQIVSTHFATFVHQWLVQAAGYITRLFEWFTGPCPGVYVMRQESLRDDLVKVLHRLGYDGVRKESLYDGTPKAAPVSLSAVYGEGQLQRLIEAERPAIQRWYGGQT